MQLTKQADYAVRTLIYCALNLPRQSRVSDIAKAYGISELSLFKFIKPLADNGLLETVRGRNGGIGLGRAAKDISLAEVIRVTEENFILAECFEDGEIGCPLAGNCEGTNILSEALAAFFAVLEKSTIDDLVKRPKLLRKFLNIEAPAVAQD